MRCSTVTALVFLLGLLDYTVSQESANEIVQGVSNLVDTSNFNELNNTPILPAIEEATNLFKQKCEKNGGSEAFDNAVHAQGDLERCIKSLVNVTKLQEDMEKYKPTGDLDLVFKNYCRKSPILKTCVTNFTTAIEPCLEDKEKESKKVILNITDSLLDFVCYKEGDRIALFISAGGPDCFQAKQQQLQDCINSTFSSYVPAADPLSGALPGIESLPSLEFGHKECTDIKKLQSCAVKELETCSDPTPANIVDSIFEFIIKVTPCKNFLNANAEAVSGNGASSMFGTSFLIAFAISISLHLARNVIS